MALTALACKNAKPTDSTTAKLHSDGGGLYLRVAPSKTGTPTRSWVFKFTLAGKAREMGLGALDVLDLKQARETASDLRKQVSQGVDPIQARKASQQAATALATGASFAEMAEKFIAGKQAGWNNDKHVSQWRNTLKVYCASFSAKPVGEIVIGDVENALRPIWLTKTETATRVLNRIVAVLTYATDRGLRSDDGTTWPAKLRRMLPLVKPKTEREVHMPALPHTQAPQFWAALTGTSTGTQALRFAIMCASRSGEVRNATWSEIDLEAGVWTIPAARMKMKKMHRVPLSTQAVELLRGLTQGKPDDFIFPGERSGKPLSDMTMTAAIRRLNDPVPVWVDHAGQPITQHGFRSTFRDWVSEATDHGGELAERALAHAVRDRVEAAYNRGDAFEKRRALMADWADYLHSAN